MLFFNSRNAAREFAKNGKKMVDLGATAAKRWAVKVV